MQRRMLFVEERKGQHGTVHFLLFGGHQNLVFPYAHVTVKDY